MRLCYIGDAMNPHMQKWASSLAGRGHEVHLITCRPRPIPGVAIHPVRICWPAHIRVTASIFSRLGYLTCLPAVRRTVRRIVPDILHAHWASSYGLMGAAASFHPFIISTWGGDIFTFPARSRVFAALLGKILSRADAVTATSRMLTKETLRYMEKNRTVETIPFGVDVDRFTPRTRQHSKKTVTIGIVKALEKKYGIDILIRAFAKIHVRHPEASLLIVGEGGEYKHLKALTESLGLLPKVHFYGYVENRQVPDLLNRMDIFTVPSVSHSETFGVAAVEASACALPVVASRIGGLPEVVCDGKTGFLIPPDDADALAGTLEQLIIDPGLRKRLGDAGREFVIEKYRWQESVRRMEALYDRLLSSGRCVSGKSQ